MWFQVRERSRGGNVEPGEVLWQAAHLLTLHGHTWQVAGHHTCTACNSKCRQIKKAGTFWIYVLERKKQKHLGYRGGGGGGGGNYIWDIYNTNNNNNEYLERLTCTGPKRLHVLYKYIFVKIQCIQHECTRTQTHTRMRTHTQYRRRGKTTIREQKDH